MSPRASTSVTGGDEPAEAPAEEAPAADINAVMEATQVTDTPSTDPPGSDVLTPENVRRYPHLFTDEQKASIPTDELPETDVEKAQREQAEAEA